MKKLLLLLSITLFSFQAFSQEYYEIRTYQMKFRGNLKVLEGYIQNALIPALNSYGVSKVGVFKDYGKPEPALLIVAIPFKNIEAYAGYRAALEKNAVYQEASKAYFEQVGIEKPLYEKISTYLAKGFSGHPTLTLPTKDASRIFEWRTYEAYNEDALRRKIAMFNEEELKVFVSEVPL